MTLAVIEEAWMIRGVEGPKFTVGPKCANPECGKFAEHAHHIVRRSQLGGDFRWIEIEGQIVGNLTGLCPGCHDDITGRLGGHKAAIRFLKDKQFYWCDVREVNGHLMFPKRGLLQPQPPTPDTLAARASGKPRESENCPFCGQTRRRASTTSPRSDGEARHRKSWTVLVPDDKLERGAEILDTLVDDLAVPLGVEPNRTGRYYVLVPVLYYAQSNRENFLKTIEGVGG